MMQPTHLKFGVLWCLLAIPLAVMLGLIPSLDSGYRNGDLLIVLIGLYMAVKGALFGSEFPDTDHPTSIPARKHPILKMYFETARKITGEDGSGNGPKKKWYAHRGIMSHDYVVHALRWGLAYLLVLFFSNMMMESIGNSSILILVVYIIIAIAIISFANDINHFFSYIEKVIGVQIVKDELMQKVIIYISSLLLIIILMFQNMSEVFMDVVTFNIGNASASMLIMLFTYGMKIFILFTFIGCCSHLFGDMITVSGVYFGFIQIKPMTMFKILTYIPGLKFAFDGFRTGGPWEKINNLIITVLIIPATILSLYVVFGGDISVIKDIGNLLFNKN